MVSSEAHRSGRSTARARGARAGPSDPSFETLRRATPRDGPAFLRLVGELADFEKLAPPTRAARSRLLKDAFRRNGFELFVADTRMPPVSRASGGASAGASGSSMEVVAYAIVLWTYSSFLARPTLYLEDIYLTPRVRGTGLGGAMMRDLARLARSRGAGRIEGIVLGWNRRARRFYARTGAKEMRSWMFFRYDERALRRLAEVRGRPPNRVGP